MVGAGISLLPAVLLICFTVTKTIGLTANATPTTTHWHSLTTTAADLLYHGVLVMPQDAAPGCGAAGWLRPHTLQLCFCYLLYADKHSVLL